MLTTGSNKLLCQVMWRLNAHIIIPVGRFSPSYNALRVANQGLWKQGIRLNSNHARPSNEYSKASKDTVQKIEHADSGSLGHTHSHGHSHTHTGGNPMLVMSREQFKRNPGVRITWIGLAINVGMVMGKFVGGVVFHSQALMADSLHAVGDLVSDFLTLFSVGLSANKPTAEYPNGFGKAETVGSLAVSSILAMAGFSIGWSSLIAIIGPLVPHSLLEMASVFTAHSHVHAESITKEVTNINAAWIAGGSIVLKEWIFQATKRIAIKTNSNVLMANAWHHRVDSLTSLVALVTITSGYFFNVQSLDAVGGLLVSILVIKAGTTGIYAALKELVDKAVPHNDEQYLHVENVIKTGLVNVQRNCNLRNLTVMSSGPNITANAIIEAPLRKWENGMAVAEITSSLRKHTHREVPALTKLDIEFADVKKPSA